MKSLSCKQMGNSDCEYVAEAETAEEVKQKMWEHAEHIHKDKIASMSEEEKEKANGMMDQILA